jgi:hypothetical protein
MEKLEQAIMKAWAADTSSCPELWNPRNPALGQCAVTACIVQDYFGGELLRKEVKNVPGMTSHYYNQLHNPWSIVDLTKSQFPEGAVFGPEETRERSYVLNKEKYPDSVRRYELLKERVSAILGK